MAGFFEKLGNKLDMVAEKVWKNREDIACGLITGASIASILYAGYYARKFIKERTDEQHIVYTTDPISHTFDDRVVVAKGYLEETGEEVPGVAYFSKTAWDDECEIQEMIRNGSR